VNKQNKKQTSQKMRKKIALPKLLIPATNKVPVNSPTKLTDILETEDFSQETTTEAIFTIARGHSQ
jgi:hypothetical protein